VGVNNENHFAVSGGLDRITRLDGGFQRGDFVVDFDITCQSINGLPCREARWLASKNTESNRTGFGQPSGKEACGKRLNQPQTPGIVYFIEFVHWVLPHISSDHRPNQATCRGKGARQTPKTSAFWRKPFASVPN
jgi:hypothetical protein